MQEPGVSHPGLFHVLPASLACSQWLVEGREVWCRRLPAAAWPLRGQRDKRPPRVVHLPHPAVASAWEVIECRSLGRSSCRSSEVHHVSLGTSGGAALKCVLVVSDYQLSRCALWGVTPLVGWQGFEPCWSQQSPLLLCGGSRIPPGASCAAGLFSFAVTDHGRVCGCWPRCRLAGRERSPGDKRPCGHLHPVTVPNFAGGRV